VPNNTSAERVVLQRCALAGRRIAAGNLPYAMAKGKNMKALFGLSLGVRLI
jgi:hypothetical protein